MGASGATSTRQVRPWTDPVLMFDYVTAELDRAPGYQIDGSVGTLLHDHIVNSGLRRVAPNRWSKPRPAGGTYELSAQEPDPMVGGWLAWVQLPGAASSGAIPTAPGVVAGKPGAAAPGDKPVATPQGFIASLSSGSPLVPVALAVVAAFVVARLLK